MDAILAATRTVDILAADVREGDLLAHPVWVETDGIVGYFGAEDGIVGAGRVTELRNVAIGNEEGTLTERVHADFFDLELGRSLGRVGWHLDHILPVVGTEER